MKIFVLCFIVLLGIFIFFPKMQCLIFGHKQYYPTFKELYLYKVGDTFRCVRCGKTMVTITDIKLLTQTTKR